jgi:hypothetical protein
MSQEQIYPPVFYPPIFLAGFGGLGPFLLLQSHDLDQLLEFLDHHIKVSNRRLLKQSKENPIFSAAFWGEKGS